VKQDLSWQSLHYDLSLHFFGLALLQVAILGSHKIHSTPKLVHQEWPFTIVQFLTFTCLFLHTLRTQDQLGFRTPIVQVDNITN
jgi:hypothetical protein